MNVSPAGVSLVKAGEGCRLVAYQDERGIWTIGWGHTGPEVHAGMQCSQAHADQQLERDLESFAHGVAAELPQVSIGDNAFSALVSLAYNIGLGAFAGSSVRHLVLTGPYLAIPAHIRLWDKVLVGGKLVSSPGLKWRRACECALWALPDGAPTPDWEDYR